MIYNKNVFPTLGKFLNYVKEHSRNRFDKYI